MPSDEEINYDSDDDYGCGVSDGGFGDSDYDDYGEAYDGDEDLLKVVDKRYVVLHKADILKRQEEDICHLSLFLPISRGEAITLLHYYKWNVSNICDMWFADEEKVRDAVGLPASRVEPLEVHELLCGICFEHYKVGDMRAAACRHYFCCGCWQVSQDISNLP